jgi:predicted ATPase
VGSPRVAVDETARVMSLPEPPTPFIGREAELAKLAALLMEYRLVVVTGIGGVGKTRLVLRVAQHVALRYPDGAFFVDLAPLSDPSRVAEAIAVAVGTGAGGASAEAALVAALRSRRGLLVLDNAEHLTDMVSRLMALILGECPNICVLVTSRERLGLRSECVFRLQPLPVPETSAAISAVDALQYDSIRLFVERATALIEGFVLDDGMAPAVAEICRQLDGIALAIEMAVPRLQVLTVHQFAERLDERFRLLAPSGRDVLPRQRTLRTMFDWSWELLRPSERELLQRLSAFAGTASLRSVIAVGDPDADSEWDVLDGLTALVEKSLVSVEANPIEPRYRLLQTTRDYAFQSLDSAAARELRRRHALDMATLFERGVAEWPTTHSPTWLRHHAPDADNLRLALEWAFGPDGDITIGVRLAAASYPLWWELPGLPLREARRWYDCAISRATPNTPPLVAARLWFGYAWRDSRFSDLENAPAASRAVALFREAGDAIGLGGALWRAGSATFTAETQTTAVELLCEAERVLRGQPATKWLALVLIKQADLLARANHSARALALYDEALVLARALRHRHAIMTGASNLAEVLFHVGQRELALAHLEQLRDELEPAARSPAVATLAAHLALAGRLSQARKAAREIVSWAPATGQIGALAWVAETLALMLIEGDNLTVAAQLAGFARSIHPSTATRFGSRREVFLRVDAALHTRLAPPVRTQLEAAGAALNEARVIAMAEAGLLEPAAGDEPQP